MLYDLRKEYSSLINNMLDTTTGLPSGIAALDEKLLGFSPGELIIIAGRPGMGKSSLARDIALTIGKDNLVLFYSLEMNNDEVGQLLLSNLAKIDYYAVKRGNITVDIKSQLDESSARLSTYSILINDDTCLTPALMGKELSIIMKEEPVKCVIVDYLQLMSIKGHTKRVEEVTQISRELLGIAKTFHVPVIAMSQLNRQLEYRESTRPRLSDLRESGSLEQDANKVLLIHRPSYYDLKINPDAVDTGEAELIIAKNRKGPCGVVQCAWISSWMSFKDIPPGNF